MSYHTYLLSKGEMIFCVFGSLSKMYGFSGRLIRNEVHAISNLLETKSCDFGSALKIPYGTG